MLIRMRMRARAPKHTHAHMRSERAYLHKKRDARVHHRAPSYGHATTQEHGAHAHAHAHAHPYAGATMRTQLRVMHARGHA